VAGVGTPKKENERRTLNIQHPTSNEKQPFIAEQETPISDSSSFPIKHSMFGVHFFNNPSTVPPARK
jgi:hypothetical protein